MRDGQNSTTRKVEALRFATMESLRTRQPLRRPFRLKCNCAEKDFLAHIHGAGTSGRFSAALLVGRVCDHSHRVCELVGGLS